MPEPLIDIKTSSVASHQRIEDTLRTIEEKLDYTIEIIKKIQWRSSGQILTKP